MRSSKDKARRDFEKGLTLTMGGRNFVDKPYSKDENRVAQWFFEVTGVGGGDDPIGFLLLSHVALARERKELKQQIAALKLDNDRLYGLMSEASPISRNMEALGDD